MQYMLQTTKLYFKDAMVNISAFHNLLCLCARPAWPVVPELKMHAPSLDPSPPTATEPTQPIRQSHLHCSLLYCTLVLSPPHLLSFSAFLTDREGIGSILDNSSQPFMRGQQSFKQQEDSSQREPEWEGPSSGPGAQAGGLQGPGLKRASSQSEQPSFSRMSQKARESIGVIGQGLKQLFQQQRRHLSLSRFTITSLSSSSSSSLVSAGGISLSGPEDASKSCCPDSDPLYAPVVPSAAGQSSAAVGIMRRGTSLQSRRSKGSGSGSGSGDRDPLLRGSPQVPHRRNTHDPQHHTTRPRSSSTTDTTPSSPAPGYVSSDVVLSSEYQSTEETDRVSDSSHDSYCDYTGWYQYVSFILLLVSGLVVSELSVRSWGSPCRWL